MAHYVIRFARRTVVAALFVTAALAGVTSGVLFAYASDLPQIAALDNYAPSTITRVHAADGQVIGEFAVQRRILVGYDEMAPRLREAIVAAEDGDFNRHVGLSISSIAIRLAHDVLDAVRDRLAGRRSRPAGGSTLTQQLARNLFPEAIGFTIGDLSIERKIKEALVAIQIEKRYTKREILTLYANHVPFGHGRYGVESAARLYFDKSAKDLSLEEAALLAGIVQRPARQSPFVDLNAATIRRDYALQRMAEEGYITRAEADAARARPVVVRGRLRSDQSVAPFFIEEVRKHLEQTWGEKPLYEGGLSVETTLDVRLQQAANRAVDKGLRALDKRRGFRSQDIKHALAEGQTPEGYRHERWDRPMAAGDIVPALVTSVNTAAAELRVGPYRAELRRDGMVLATGRDWTRGVSPGRLFRPGDLIDVALLEIDPAAQTARVRLDQEPAVEGALVAIDNRTGQVRAMVGGYSFDRSKFNRAVQALRQVGSGFKPFVYAAAIDRGYTPLSIIVDEPTEFSNGENQPPYVPQNYDGKYEGPITLRHALEDSRNVPAVWMISQISPAQVVAYARRFGLTGPLQPYLSLALGATEASLIEMTSAYSVFPNQGVRMTPYLIAKVTDRDGNLLEENRPQAHDALRTDTAYVMTNLLRGVVQNGTARAALSLRWPLGGKTGTTDDYSDAWFIGFDPNLTVGVWVGHDERRPLGRAETGAQAALPIWMDVMEAYLADKDRETLPRFEPPSNIVFVADPATGPFAHSPLPGKVPPEELGEAFIAGTEPR